MKNFLIRRRRDVYFLRHGYRPRIESLNHQRFGSHYGGWVIATDEVNADTIVYSFGIGEDASFDFELIAEYGLNVYGFDPTPKSINWIKANPRVPDSLHFQEWGLSDFDGMLTVYAPTNPEHVSHSIVNNASTEAVEFPVKRLATCMQELNHDRIDILKMDIEGSEYGVLEELVAGPIRPRQILVEFHHRVLNMGFEKTRRAVDALHDIGYRPFHISDSGNEFSFIRQSGD